MHSRLQICINSTLYLQLVNTIRFCNIANKKHFSSFNGKSHTVSLNPASLADVWFVNDLHSIFEASISAEKVERETGSENVTFYKYATAR